jgi:hypothetical protein
MQQVARSRLGLGLANSFLRSEMRGKWFVIEMTRCRDAPPAQ